MAHAWTICREVDLARDFVGVERIAALATTSAKAAHELHIAVKSGGVSIGTDGASVALNLILPDGISTMADGSIESGECIATLPPLCYQRGETRGVLLLQFGTQAAIPVYAFVLRCFEDLTDAFADPDHVIPSLAELLAQLAAAKAAAKAAQDGASAANAAAGAANAAAGNANAAAGTASAAAKTASNAADTANAAAERLNGLKATATGLETGRAPTVDVTQNEDGTRVLAFGIPRGATGATPNLTVNVATGDPGTQASVVQSGTAENPVLLLTIPKGDTGDIGNLTINGKTPDAGGAVTLTANDLGAATAEEVSQLKSDKLDKTGTAADSSKLGGKTLAEIMLALYPVGAVYISANSTSPASLFGGTWESISGRFLLAADSTYSAGSTGGEATHKLTVSEMPSHRHANVRAAQNYLTAWATENSGSYDGFELSGLFKQNLREDLNTFSGDYSGGGAPHNNMPPYLAVYMWKRVS